MLLNVFILRDLIMIMKIPFTLEITRIIVTGKDWFNKRNNNYNSNDKNDTDNIKVIIIIAITSM